MGPAFTGTTIDRPEPNSDLPRHILLHAVGHLDQPPPGTLHERHQTIHVLVAWQRNLELAFAVRRLRFDDPWSRLSIRLRQRVVGLALHLPLDRPFARGELRFQLFVFRLQPADSVSIAARSSGTA